MAIQLFSNTNFNIEQKKTRKIRKQKQKKAMKTQHIFFLISNSDTKMSVSDFLFLFFITDFFLDFSHSPLLFISFAKQHNISLHRIPIMFENKSFKYLIDVNKFLHNNYI